MVRATFSYLGVDEGFIPDISERFMVNKDVSTSMSTKDHETMMRLTLSFHNDLEKLQPLIDRDLSAWFEIPVQ